MQAAEPTSTPLPQGVLLERNVAFNISGHAYFIEDGGEWDNTLRGNLGMLVRGQGAEVCSEGWPAAAPRGAAGVQRWGWGSAGCRRLHLAAGTFCLAAKPACLPGWRAAQPKPHLSALHCTTPTHPPAAPPQVLPKTAGARLGSDRAGANGDLSVYWITNPDNTFEDNVAAATEGWGT